MNKEILDLIEEVQELYRLSASTVQITKAEIRLWTAAKATLATPVPRALDWFKQNVDPVRSGGVETRQALLSAGASVLLNETDAGLSLAMAQRICVEAKNRKRVLGITLDAAIAATLADYRRTKKVVQISISDIAKGPVDVDVDVSNSKELYSAIRKLTAQYLKQRLPKADPNEQNEIVEEFTADMRVAYDSMLLRISRYGRNSKRFDMINVGQVDQACADLDMVRSEGSETVDMEWARRQHRKLSTRLHPDRNSRNSDPRIVAQYTAVQEAWQLLQEYERQQIKSVKGRATHRNKT